MDVMSVKFCIFVLMKNSLIRFGALLGIVFCGVGSLLAQGFELENGKTEHTFYPNSDMPVDCTIHFKNIKKSPIVFAYEKVIVDFPTVWDVSFCDNRNCFASFLDKDTMAKVAPNAEASLKITVFPNGKADTAVVKYALWDYENTSDRDTLTWNIYIRWSAETKSWKSEAVQVYPNPVDDVLNVSNLGDAVLEVVDSRGAVVKNTKSVEGRMDVSELASGLYFIHCQFVDKMQTISFVKK
jgi:hypothetical protein